MWKLTGVFLLLGGMAGILYSWTSQQKINQRRGECFLLFLQKSIHMMQEEKIKVIDYFERYIEEAAESNERVLEQTLKEIIHRLSSNTYPKGQTVWEDVIREGNYYGFDQEVLQIIVQAGNGFFGRCRDENIAFLQKSIRELELQLVKMKEKSAQERKVWIPVGMLGSVMLAILFI